MYGNLLRKKLLTVIRPTSPRFALSRQIISLWL